MTRGGGRSRSGRRGGDSGTREAILAAARTRFGDLGYAGATIRGIAADAGVDAALVHHFFGTKERLFAAAMRMPLIPGEVISGALAPGARDPGLTVGEHLLATVLQTWDVAEMRATFLGLLRSAVTSDQAAAMLREFVTEAILTRLAGASRPARAGEAPGDGPPGHGGTGGARTGGARTGGARTGGARTGGARTGGARTGGARTGGGASAADAEFRAALVASQVLGLALTKYVLELEPLVAADTRDLAAAIGPVLDRYLTGQVR